MQSLLDAVACPIREDGLAILGKFGVLFKQRQDIVERSNRDNRQAIALLHLLYG